MPHCFCRVLGGRSSFFRIPPPSDTPISGFSATILTTSPRSLSDKRPLGHREICRRLHDGLQAGAHNKNMDVSGAGVNGAESRVPYAPSSTFASNCSRRESKLTFAGQVSIGERSLARVAHK